MRHASKDLLCLERKDLPSSSFESSLLVCKKNSTSKEPCRNEKPITEPAPKSQVLGRVKDFLGVLSEANKKLQLDAKDDAEKYDIEALNGDESEVIELDLMLGIADLHTPEAVAAAESAIIGLIIALWSWMLLNIRCSNYVAKGGLAQEKELYLNFSFFF
ncbi:uncharacterized protein LOC111443185 isoform X2 [Cucurbita moschata]|uniref:Uncharacterized protein LOC111443185 isoform X2 n=1 Tax=Cucurbita moschata TaxID=3662 RepID=A0A6J1F848_CUCMO|nr:uncharacterized protein LOC111443185 isoform X2 [Cucurbita moschata]